MGVSRPRIARRTTLVTEETRELILEAAEAEFAARGQAAARLEDIAERVGITRAAIIYHFKDKQALYDAVLEASFTPLTERIREVVSDEGSHVARIERMVEAWIDYAALRPTLARLFMREVADSHGELRPEVMRLAAPMYTLFMDCVEAGLQQGEFRPIDPSHLMSILAGATVWFVTGAPVLEGPDEDDSRHQKRIDDYRCELLGVTRYLLRSRDAAEGTTA